MKRFYFTRLREQEKDYRTYVAPVNKIGFLRKAIASEAIGSRETCLFIEGKDDHITFGVREPLDLTDEGGRPIWNFTGYQLEKGEQIPYFDAFKAKRAKITEDAYAVHESLNAQKTEDLQTTNFTFSPGYRGKTGWDEIVRVLRKNPTAEGLVMFDAQGAKIPLPASVQKAMASAAPQQPEPEPSPPKETRLKEPTRPPSGIAVKAPVSEPWRKASAPVSTGTESDIEEGYTPRRTPPGMQSNITLDPSERVRIPPIPLDNTPDSHGFCLKETIRDIATYGLRKTGIMHDYKKDKGFKPD